MSMKSIWVIYSSEVAMLDRHDELPVCLIRALLLFKDNREDFSKLSN